MRRRYVYWLSARELRELEERMRAENKRITPVKGVPCKGFNELVETSYVAPEEWNKVCGRQGGWYRESERRGQYLVVSAEPLVGVERGLAAIVDSCDFTPPRLPDAREVADLARSEAVRSRLPEGWQDTTDRERAGWRRRLSKLGSDMTLDDLIELHTANHANFIEPRFHVESPEDSGPAPYSIGRTAEVCSACVELSGLLGSEYPVRYVMPCPGFVTFTKLPADQYLRVSTPHSPR
jgi:hypothetical protein